MSYNDFSGFKVHVMVTTSTLALARVSYSYCRRYMWRTIFHRKVQFWSFNSICKKKYNTFFYILVAFYQYFKEKIQTKTKLIFPIHYRIYDHHLKKKEKKFNKKKKHAFLQNHYLWKKKKFFLPDKKLGIGSGKSPNKCPSLFNSADS